MHLTVLLGAPGAGKTTLLSHLHADAAFLVADMDEILEDGAILGVPVASDSAASHWPAYNRLWVRIISMMTRAGVPVLLSAPLTPAEWYTAVAEVGAAMPTGFVLLDCEDKVRSARLAERGWSSARISAARADAAELRELDLPVLDTTARPVAEVAVDLCSLVVRDHGPDAG
jgi:broad-specificity NMP kinase